MTKKQIYLLLLLFFSTSSMLLAQELSSAKKAEVAGYIQQAERFLNEDNKNMAVSNYSKIASIYWDNGLTTEAISYFEKTLQLSEQLGNKNGIKQINTNLAYIYTDLGNDSKALFHFQKAYEATRNTKDKDKTNIIECLNNIAMAQKSLKMHNEAIATLKESLGYALEEKDNQKLLRSCYSELAENYQAIGDMENWKLNYGYFISFNSYVMGTEKLEIEKKQAVALAQATAARLKLKLTELEYALTKDSLQSAAKLTKEQQMEIDLLNQTKKINDLELQKREAEIQKARTEKYILFGILGIIFIIFILVFFQFRQKKKANKLLAEKNKQLEQQKDEISMKNLSLRSLNTALEKQKAEIVASNEKLEILNKELAGKNQQIEQSIVYASKIQEAILPSQKAIQTNFPNSFIFYRPRDIVSGDFYWYSAKNGKQIIAAVDCTGHSVPGAFMSMIGNTLLNEIVNEKNIMHPAMILDKLHEGIVNTLNQGRDNDPKDGMDITLCVIDKENRELEIAAANHSVFIITGNELQEIEGDIFSIGDEMLLNKVVNFTNHTIFLDEDTSLYMMSDGYQDQFGGDNNSKFMKLNVKKLLIANQHLSLEEQGKLMASKFDEWRGDKKQIDDVLMIGLKIEC